MVTVRVVYGNFILLGTCSGSGSDNRSSVGVILYSWVHVVTIGVL